MSIFPEGVTGDAAFDPRPPHGEYLNIIGHGSEWEIGCICCDFAAHSLFLANALVAVAPCEAAAQRILELFPRGAKRHPHPNPQHAPHVVLVFGACRTHRSKLHDLEEQVLGAGHILTPEVVAALLANTSDDE